MNPTGVAPNINQEAQQFGNYSNWAKNQLQGGANLSSLQSDLSQHGINPTMQPQAQGNWFERLLPTIGGIGGGILGSLVAPIAGTAAGAGIGGALGQEAENLLTGSKGSTMASGLENAAGGLLGGAGGEAIGAIAGKLGGAADEAGINSLMRQFGGNLSKADATTLYGKGITNAQQLKDIIPELTGSSATKGINAAYTNGVENAVGNANPTVDLTDIHQNLPDMFQNHEMVLNDRQAGNIQDTLDKAFNKMSNDSGNNTIITATSKGKPIESLPIGSLKNMQGGAVYDTAQQLQSQGNQILNSISRDWAGNPVGEGGLAKEAQGKILKNVGDQLEQRVTSQIPMTQADKNLLIDNISSLKQINPKLYNSEVNAIKNFGNWQDAIGQQSLYVHGSNALKALDNQAGGQIGKTPLDILGKNKTDTAIGLIKNNKALNVGETKGLSKIAPFLKGTTGQKVLPLMTRASAIAAANLPNMASSTASATSPALLSQIQNNNQQGGMGMNGQGNPLQDIIQAGILDPNQYGSMLNTLEPLMQKAQVAQNAMGMLPELYAQGGGGQGLLGGLLSNIEGLVPGTAQYNYMQARQAAAKAGAPFGISSGFMPNFMQSPMGAQSLFSANQGLLSGLAG